MIAHFIRRDFVSYKLSWMLLAVFTVLGGACFVKGGNTELLLLMGYGYFFFAMMPLQQLTGVTWRSQHIMSRNFLLSLPLSRKRLFLILQIRAAVFCLPLFLAAVLPPLFMPALELKLAMRAFSYPLYVLAVAGGILWFLNQQMGIQLRLEKVNTYLSPHRRGWAILKSILGFALQALIALPPLLATPFLPPLLACLPLFLILAYQNWSVKKAWLGNL